jgi:hypothetical protein
MMDPSDTRVFLTNLTNAGEYGRTTIDQNPPTRVVFVQRINGVFHRWEGTLSVEQMFAALSPALEHTEKPMAER